MANTYISWQTSNDLPMQDTAVLETNAGTTFPVGFGTVLGGTANVMVIVNTTAYTGANIEAEVRGALERINKKLDESLNLN
jgi:hypothetical protein